MRRPRKIGEVFAEWRTFLGLSRSPGTAASYVREIEPWLNSFGLERMFSSIRFDEMMKFGNAAEARKPTRLLRLAAMRHLFRYALQRGWSQSQEVEAVFVNHRGMKLDQLESSTRLPFSANDYGSIMASTSGFWHYATALAWWLGLRVGDICSLEKASVLDNEIVVWTRKRGKRVALSLDDPLIGSGELRAVLVQMKAAAPADSPYFFPDYQIRYQFGWDGTMSNEFAGVLRAIGLKGPGKSFHSLRHSAITRWKASGKSIDDIGRLVAHSNPETTAGYIHQSPAQ